MKHKAKALKLPIHAASGMYTKCIGRALNTSGNSVRKDWYFDPANMGAAVSKIEELKRRWNALTAAGKTLWDEEPQYAAERSMKPAEVVRKTPTGIMKVSDGLERYLTTIEDAWKAGQCDKSHYTSQKFRLAAVAGLTITYRGQSMVFGSLPLPGISRAELEAIVLLLCSRPLVTSHHYKDAAERHEGKLPTQKMSESYSASCKASLKAAMKWLKGEHLWTECNHFDSIWKHQVVVTDDELADRLDEEDGEVDHFELAELVKLWKATEDTLKPLFWKSMILTSLNFGFANSECSTLKGREVKQVTAGTFSGQYVVERYRSKTVKKAKRKSWARWYAWPETVALLTSTCATWERWTTVESWNSMKLNAATYPIQLPATATPIDPVKVADALDQAKNENWFLTDEGKLLNDNNTIGQGWRRLTKSAGVRNLSFKFMRKTAAHIVRNELGYSAADGKLIADMLLSHSESGVITAYAGRAWDETLKPATEKMRTYLASMLVNVSGELKTLTDSIADVRQRAFVEGYRQTIVATKVVVNGKVKVKRKAA
jgi:hypothetical protein